MLKMIITDAVVSKGFDGNAAIRFFNGENGFQSVNFRIGKRVYDAKAENDHRWINLNVKGFGMIVERIKKLKLKEGSFINLVARYDEETWEDRGTGNLRSAPVLILDDIEYSFNGGKNQKDGQSTSDKSVTETGAPNGSIPRSGRGYSDPPQEPSYPPAPQGQPYPPEPMPRNFSGFANFDEQQGGFF